MGQAPDLFRDPGLLTRIGQGVRRAPWRFVGRWFVAYSGGWAILEPILHVSDPGSTNARLILFLILLILSALVALTWSKARDPVAVHLPGSSTDVKIAVRDLFSTSRHLVIPVNEFFDSQLGNLVAANSVHGQCIHQLFKGDSARFESETSAALAGNTSVGICRSEGRQEKYPIGAQRQLVLCTDDNYSCAT